MADIDPQALVDEAAKRIETLTIAEAAQRHSDGAQFIDVREPQEWPSGYIEGTLHIPRGTLEFSIGDQVRDPRRRLVLYCGSGARAILACAQLQRLGFDNAAAMVQGGYDEWAEAGYPTSSNPVTPFFG